MIGQTEGDPLTSVADRFAVFACDVEFAAELGVFVDEAVQTDEGCVGVVSWFACEQAEAAVPVGDWFEVGDGADRLSVEDRLVDDDETLVTHR